MFQMANVQKHSIALVTSTEHFTLHPNVHCKHCNSSVLLHSTLFFSDGLPPLEEVILLLCYHLSPVQRR